MNKTDKLSDHLTLGEFTKSQTAIKNGIDNMPTPEHLENAKKWALNIYEPLRKKFGAILLTIGYRSKALNAKTPGASLTSFHCRAMAGDLDDTLGAGKYTNKDIFLFIYNNLEYAELIWEHGDDNNPDWVHVAFEEGKNVKETIRTATRPKKGGKPGETETYYVNFDIKKIKQ